MSGSSFSLDDRMKRYENVSRMYLTRRVPVIIRIDGKAFHTFTRGMKKPFDRILMTAMQETMRYLCENIQGCVLGYTQSDEITLVLTDYTTVTTDAWFGYGVQKMSSISASMATMAFNSIFVDTVNAAQQFYDTESSIEGALAFNYLVYEKKFWSAMFDARAFSVPVEEVCNCLIWRQQDATRNSIEAAGQAHFSAGRLHGKNCNQIQEMLWQEHSINWNDYPVDFKRGSCCRRETVETSVPDPRNPKEQIPVTRRKWVVDTKPPIFTKDRAYIDALL